MPTKSPRINITLEDKTVELLTILAKQQNTSVAGLAKELILDSLDRREDMYLSAIAEQLDVETAKRVKDIDAWK
jgi:hypothetical protein